ncbi:type III-B CRISPR module RAMP protein Cmr1 [Vibrio cholerae]|uniref:type III-B CRISPR module RAMP protein Cmr1 n=1 Tax=Vibrio cholerae TaxID=666 RepID=UPI000E0ADE2C|nr:type III-B CRISPR module RAMP protein Cmr1 [Vibrio cholerae]EHZ7429029.1 type III-B CRISPR module RAMP protein Cmr1 [Vibrio cholerae]EJL6361838.1 type III-B CRISPR module RAMP protein Cmr1 [Vibrio cholerae]
MRRQNNTIDLQRLKEELDDLNNKINDKWESYSCTLVTPMYGGGVKAGEVDNDMPIRASAIRGQLRFWWRIACGPENSNELFKKEIAIWGGIGDEGAVSSQVQIRVKHCKGSDIKVKTVAEFKHKKSDGIKYVLGTTIGDNAKLPSLLGAEEKVTFFVEVCCNANVKSDVNQALRWWASFGGIGAKTRRGFGAVEVEGIEPIPITDFHNKQTSKGCKLALAKGQYNDAKLAWEKATDSLYEFRQQPGIGRNKGKEKKEGRSFWPEADQLRHLTGKNDNGRHMPEFEKSLIFPRAAFGLPIQFQFPGQNNDPDKMNLYPEDSERLASPLILRPYLDENKKWRALALLLPNWKKALTQPLTLKLSSNNEKVTYQVNHWPDENQQAERDRLTNDIKPMKGRANDPLSAFLDYFKQGQ